jgi:ABC-type amino acid transport substrate-binding protein
MPGFPALNKYWRALAGLGLALMPASGLGAPAAEEVAVYSYDLPPVVYDHRGEISGPAARIVAALCRTAGLSEKPVPVPVARLLTTVEEGRAIAFPLARNPEREPRFHWIVKLYDDSFSFATLKPHSPVLSLDQARRLPAVTVNNAGAPKNLLAAQGFTNLDQANSEAQNAFKLFAGNVDAWFSVSSGFRPIARINGMDPARIEIGPPIHRVEAYLIGSKNLPESLVDRLRNRFAEMKANGEYDAIMKGVFD